MDRRRFAKNKFQKDPLHWTAANDWPKEIKKCLQKGANPYRPNDDGLTPLHAAIANNAMHGVSLLLDQYSSDVAIVREHMEKRFLWKPEINCWKKRPILIACSEAECAQVQLVASSCPSAIPFNIQIFVLLRSLSEGNRLVALDVCSESKRTAVFACIRQLLNNGVLSLDKSDLRKDCMTYLQTACMYGNEKMIALLISHGAQLSITGENGAIPLLSVCNILKQDTMKLLLTKYVNRYDPTVCDSQGRNAFHIVLQKNNPAQADYVLKALIKYRMAQFSETESQAFNRIFPYEYEELDCIPTWSFVRPNVKNLVTEYVVQYRLDLTYKWGGNLHVLDLLSRKIALDYCFEEIRANHDILRLDAHREMNVLHRLLDNDLLAFVEELYAENPAVRKIFETKGAFEILQGALHKQDMNLLTFILQHHTEFLRSRPDELIEFALGATWFGKCTYQKPFALLAESFPEMQHKINETIALATKVQKMQSFRDVYSDLTKNFERTIETLTADAKHLQDILDDQQRNVLHQAVEWNEPLLIRKLLDYDGDLMNCQDEMGNLPIFLVRSMEALEMLYEKTPVGPTDTNTNGYNLLHHSCKFGHYNSEKVLSKLVSWGYDVNQATNDGSVPLSLASCCSTVKFLLQNGAKLELINGTALGSTLNDKQRCAAWALIPKIAHFDWFEGMAHKYLPWMLGGQNRDFFMCSTGYHLEEYPELRKTLFDSLYKHTPDEAAEFFRKVCHRAINSCARWFLDYGYEIDFDLRDQDDYTPLNGLLSYMEEENLDVVERLLKKGVNPNIKNQWGRNALLAIVCHFRSAQWYGHSLATIELLLDYGAEIDAQDTDGNTALHHAFMEGQLELVELLIKRGANRKLRNNQNKLPYEKGDKHTQTLYAFLC
ncbi:uncharacterized protein LOC128724378 [Anopheles nili]|uniref:uncharacterized protein LOC128724378 n=1 Tax=Anopheles nili TaxID=185578 RepID=UPI00237BB2F2|nr:uncharacterized protein LOC128724378 [Anopheles nili]